MSRQYLTLYFTGRFPFIFEHEILHFHRIYLAMYELTNTSHISSVKIEQIRKKIAEDCIDVNKNTLTSPLSIHGTRVLYHLNLWTEIVRFFLTSVISFPDTLLELLVIIVLLYLSEEYAK